MSRYPVALPPFPHFLRKGMQHSRLSPFRHPKNVPYGVAARRRLIGSSFVLRSIPNFSAASPSPVVKQGRESMKSFNWQNLLRSHPIFSSLSEEEIAHLLRDEVSQERVYPQGAVILRGGGVGDSLFLISSGSVQITLGGTGGPLFSLAILQAGEIFGEMAVLERRPRSATVLAKEDCLLLEVAGTEIRKLLEAHLEMQVKMYTIIRDRLRQASQP